MTTLATVLQDYPGFEELQSKLHKNGEVLSISGCTPSSKLHVASTLSEKFNSTLIITHNDMRVREIVEDYRLFDRNVCVYPAKDMMFYQADIHGNLQTKERLKVIKAILDNENSTIVTTFDALMNHAVPAERIAEYIIILKKDDTIDVPKLQENLVALGYERNYQVETEGIRYIMLFFR